MHVFLFNCGKACVQLNKSFLTINHIFLLIRGEIMNIKEVLSHLQKKPTSLFYGAGVSMACGGPSGAQLISSIGKKYSGDDTKGFFEYMSEVIDFDNSNRNEIEKYIRNHLSSISPDTEHRYLFSLPWRVVLTTNYDALPDLIPKTLDDQRLIIPVVNPDSDFPIDQTRPDLLYCFKLLGDVNHAFPKGGWMVLSSTDLRLAFRRRSMFFEMFHNLASSGHIVYLGYSFKDSLVFDLLQEMRFVLKALPWKGFAITKSKPSTSVLKKMEKLGITWVKGTVREFVDAAEGIFGDKPTSAPSIVSQFFIHNLPMELERATAANIWRKFRLFDTTFLEPFSREPRYFLEGIDKSFYPFVARWDFPRKVKLAWVNEKSPQAEKLTFDNYLETRSQKGNSSDNIIISLVGSAGSGKTVVAKRLAFDWYRKGNPVVFVNPDNFILDDLALDGLLDEVWKKYQSQLQTKDIKPLPLRFLIVADDCGFLLEQLMALKNHLKSVGKPADILLVTRKVDVPIPRLIMSKVDAVMEIDDTVLEEEWNDFITHFSSLDVVKSEEVLTANLQNSDINNSFFALVYTSIHGVQKPLKELIVEEFQSLDANSQRIYALISLLQSHRLMPWVSLALRSGKFERDWLTSQMEKGRLGGVLRFGFGNLSLSAVNRAVSDIICEFAFRRLNDLYSTLRSVINAVTLGDELEMQLLHLLLINRLEGGLGRRLRDEQKIQLFEEGVNSVKSKPLLLHLAMLQMRSEKFNEANATLKEALEAHIRHFDEPDQHVVDAKGRLELRLAAKAIESHDREAAWGHLEKAEEYFHNAQINPAHTPHPYHGLGKTYIAQAKIAPDDKTRWLYLLLAMQEANYAENYLGGEMDLSITALKLELVALLNSEKLDQHKIEQITERVGKGNAYAFLAEREMRQRNLEDAFALVKKGLQEDSSCLWLIRLHVTLLRKMSPDDQESIEKALENYVKIIDKRFDVQLSFELAMETFKSGDFRYAMKLFRELSERTRRHPMRLTPSLHNRWLEKGEAKEFFGVMVEPPTYGKYGQIQVTSLSGFRKTIRVRRQDIESQYKGGERVAFSIIFNMIGPQASRVRKTAF